MEVRDQVFDVAICVPTEVGGFAGGAVFANVDLGTDAPAEAEFGVASKCLIEGDSADVYGLNLFQYLNLQRSRGVKSMVDLTHDIYGVSSQELLAKDDDVIPEWRNPLLNPLKVV